MDAGERFWYIADVKEGAQIFMGFKKEMTARSFFDYASKHHLKDAMNEIEPEIGEFLHSSGNTILQEAE